MFNTKAQEVWLDESRDISKIVGGFNPFEKYESHWKSSPSRGENQKSLKPPPSKVFFFGGHQKITSYKLASFHSMNASNSAVAFGLSFRPKIWRRLRNVWAKKL